MINYTIATTGNGLEVPDFKRLLEKSYEPTVDDYNDFLVDKELSGKRVQVYYNPNTKQTVVTHRGSQGIHDWINNIRYGVFNDTSAKRFKHSAKIARLAEQRYGDDAEIIHIGHSQGAKLANTVAKPEQEVLSYNGATTVYDRFQKPRKTTTHVRNKDDVVSVLANNNVINIRDKKQSRFNVLKNHSFDSLKRIKGHIGKKVVGTGGGASRERIMDDREEITAEFYNFFFEIFRQDAHTRELAVMRHVFRQNIERDFNLQQLLQGYIEASTNADNLQRFRVSLAQLIRQFIESNDFTVLFDYYMTEPQTTHEEDEIPNFDGSGIKGRRRKKL